MLIRNAEIWSGPVADVRIRDGRIVAIGALQPDPEEVTIEAAGGALLPGLHDHHIHLAATAAAMDSIFCGPPEIKDPGSLAVALDRSGDGASSSAARAASVGPDVVP